LPNVLSAVCIGKSFNVSDEAIQKALEAYIPSNSRSQLIKKGANVIILDAYNANPSSMKLAIDNFANMPVTNKILMLGGMMELGEASHFEHIKLIELIQQHHWLYVVLVGNQFAEIHKSYLYFDHSAQGKRMVFGPTIF
jgi:UDP-N-acetylmuramoyl-tripeptide--D-alanyl-D-alanine ligase